MTEASLIEKSAPVSEKVLDLIGQKMMRKESVGRHEADHVRRAFGRLVERTQGLGPTSQDAKRAFAGFINLGARTGLASSGERESSFLAARIQVVASAHGRTATTWSKGAGPWCEALGVAGPRPGDALDGKPTILIEAGGTVHASVTLAEVTVGGEAFAEAFAALAAAGMRPVPATMARIEEAFAPFLDRMEEGRYLKASYNAEGTATGAVNHVYDRWEPRFVSFPGMRPHPAALIEAKTLASVRVPVGRLTPRVPTKAVTSGALSDAQLETVSMAVNAHERRIEVMTTERVIRVRQGFLIADGTGTGKTNEIAGIVADSWNRGRRRHVVVVEKDGHVANFRKAFAMIGLDAPISRYVDVRSAAGAVTASTGVVALTYATLRTRDRKDEFPVMEALVEWMSNGGLDGVIVFDESQNLRNSSDSVEQANSNKGRFHKDASNQALAACELQDAIADARVVYASATSATELNNIAYMSRLGVWGPGTPYKDFKAFAGNYRDTGMSLETIPLHLKSTGVMTSRTLSLEGIDYGLITHNLDVAQTDHYQALTSLIARTARLTREYLEAAAHVVQNQSSSQMRHIGHVEHAVYGAHVPLMQTLSIMSARILDATDVAMMMPSVLRATDEARDAGLAPMFQISRTGEAETRRALASGRDSGEEVAIVDTVIEFIEGVLVSSFGFRVNQGKASQAIQPAIKALVAEWRALPSLASPLDQIMMHYGPSEIAEVTGRKVRRVPADPSDPSKGYVVETRGDDAALRDHADFMADRKMGAVFSVAFGGSGYDYHAARDCRNQRRRFHVVLETGDQADVAIQGLGRSHRNNQVSAPMIRLATCDIPGVAIRNTRVVKRMATLGAISMGHREATGRTLFDGIDDFDSAAAGKALEGTLTKVKADAYPDLTSSQLSANGALMGHTGNDVATSRTLKFFKGLRMAPLDFQRRFVERYLACYEGLDEKLRNHVGGSGPFVVRDPMRMVSEETIYRDEVSDETVEAVRLEGTVKPEYASFLDSYDEATAFCMAGELPKVRYRKADQSLFILAKVDAIDLGDLRKPTWRKYSPDGVSVINEMQRQALGGAPPAEGLAAVDLWDDHKERIRKINEKSKILIRGAILRVVPVIAESNANQRLVIVPMEDGRQIAGYMIDEAMLERIRIVLPELARKVREKERKEVRDAVEKGCRIMMSNGMLLESMSLSPDMLSVEPRGGHDPDGNYLTLTMDPNVSTGATRRWLRNQGLARLQGVGSRDIQAFPMGRADEVLANLLAIADAVDFDAP